jgi:hypothetical protein
VRKLPSGTAYCIAIVFIVMMTGRLVSTKGSLALAVLSNLTEDNLTNVIVAQFRQSKTQVIEKYWRISRISPVKLLICFSPLMTTR